MPKTAHLSSQARPNIRVGPYLTGELSGIQDDEVPGGTGNPAYTEALAVLDEDMDQYIHDNTDDEITHFTFLNAYLASHGVQPNHSVMRAEAGRVHCIV